VERGKKIPHYEKKKKNSSHKNNYIILCEHQKIQSITTLALASTATITPRQI
jgi:hypothetical protein